MTSDNTAAPERCVVCALSLLPGQGGLCPAHRYDEQQPYRGIPEGAIFENKHGDLFRLVDGQPQELVENGVLDCPEWGPFRVVGVPNGK